MQLYTRNTLIDRMIQAVRSQTDAITYYGPGPFRAFLYAVAGEVQHLYYKLFQVEKRLDLLSATGADLDNFAAARGLTRRGAIQSSALLTIEADAVISATGTITASGTTVTGTGTAFLTELAPGDRIIVGGQEVTVTSDPIPADDGAITVDSSLGTIGSPTAFQIRKLEVTVPLTPTALEVVSPAGTVFEAMEDVVLHRVHSSSDRLRGVLRVRSQGAGRSQNVPARALRTIRNVNIVPLVSNVTATNDAASQGGAEAENDAAFRNRIISLFAGLNQGTARFYEAQVRLLMPRVSRIYLARGPNLNEVLVYCLTEDGSPLTPSEKTTLTAGLMLVTPVQTMVTIRDMVLLPIDVEFTTTLLAGVNEDDVANALAEVYREYLNWVTWPFERSVQADDLLRLASDVPGVDSLTIDSFIPGDDVVLPPATLPRVGTITVRNAGTGSSTVVSSVSTVYKKLT